MLNRRAWLATAGGTLAFTIARQLTGQTMLVTSRTVAPTPRTLPAMHAYIMPKCDCCEKWVDRMRAYGFSVTSEVVKDQTVVRERLGVAPNANANCHTSVVSNYVIEGHVPADLIERLINEQSPLRGLAVNGMPGGAPGMETPGVAAEHYDVLAFDNAGKFHVYASR